MSETGGPSLLHSLQQYGWIITIAVAVVLFFIGNVLLQRRKELAYVVESNRLISRQEEVKGELRMLDFESKPVDDPHLVFVEIGNMGNQAIPSNAFDRAIRFSFGDGTYIVKATAIDHSPRLQPNVRLIDSKEGCEVTSRGDMAELETLSLNSGERIKIKMIVGNTTPQSPNLRVDGHVTDVNIEERDKLEDYNTRIKGHVRGFIEGISIIALVFVAVLGMAAFASSQQSPLCALLPQLDPRQCTVTGAVIMFGALAGALLLRRRMG